MDAKKLYKKHLSQCIPHGYVSNKQMESLRYEATVAAIEEAMRTAYPTY